MATPKISLVIPVLNEAPGIVQSLSALQSLRAAGHELIVVDGGSTDDSLALSRSYSDRVIRGPRGRSRQMNAGASIASGDIFLFVHADTFLPAGADRLIIEGLKRHRKSWGRFDVRLSGKHLLLRVVGYLMNMRSRVTGTATGDQAIFVRRELFAKVGGFPDIDLMEDIALSKMLKRRESPLCLWQRVLTSSRRWERNGVVRTIFLMWRLRLSYFFGSDPGRLAQQYERTRSS